MRELQHRNRMVAQTARQTLRRISRAPSGRPGEGEFAPYARADVDQVIGVDAVAALEAQRGAVLALLEPLNDAAVSSLRSAPGKWTLKEVVGHLIDDERIYAYRLLCIARGDERPLSGFDQDAYVRGADFEARPLAELREEYVAVRSATLALCRGLTPEAWHRRGIANGHSVSARGLAFHIAGHELRHLRALRERYLIHL